MLPIQQYFFLFFYTCQNCLLLHAQHVARDTFLFLYNEYISNNIIDNYLNLDKKKRESKDDYSRKCKNGVIIYDDLIIYDFITCYNR